MKNEALRISTEVYRYPFSFLSIQGIHRAMARDNSLPDTTSLHPPEMDDVLVATRWVMTFHHLQRSTISTFRKQSLQPEKNKPEGERWISVCASSYNLQHTDKEVHEAFYRKCLLETQSKIAWLGENCIYFGRDWIACKPVANTCYFKSLGT